MPEKRWKIREVIDDYTVRSLADSLNISENRMETFQSENKVVDISMQSQQLLRLHGNVYYLILALKGFHPVFGDIE